jgi:sulfate adenylyltransferase subunit 1
LLEHLETVEVSHDLPETSARFQVQYVIRPGTDDLHDYRGYAGNIRSGGFRVGDRVKVLPSGIETRISALETNLKSVDQVFVNQSVVLHLADDIDISRGDVIVPADDVQPYVSQDIDLDICWMGERPLQVGDRLLVRHHTHEVKAIVKEIAHRIDVHSFDAIPTERLELNDIARIRLRTAKPLVFDAYRNNRNTGGLILINESTHDTVAAGMLRRIETDSDEAREGANFFIAQNAVNHVASI